MNKTRRVDVKCAGCDTFLRKTRGKKKIVKDENDARRSSLLLQKEININDILCQKCRLSAYKKEINAKKDAEFSVERGCSFESTSKDPTFTIKIKENDAISECERLKSLFGIL